MLKTYEHKDFSEYKIKLNPMCIKPNSLGKHFWYKASNNMGKHMIVNTNDLVESVVDPLPVGWICDLTKMDKLIHSLPGPLYGTQGDAVTAGEHGNVITSGVIRQLISTDSLDMRAAAYSLRSDAIKDFNDHGCREYYNKLMCKDPKAGKTGCKQWDDELGWNYLGGDKYGGKGGLTIPAAYCNHTSNGHQCALGSHKNPTKPGYTERPAKWEDTYTYKDQDKNPTSSGQGYLTVDYCNAGTAWTNTNTTTGNLIFTSLDKNPLNWCPPSYNPELHNWKCTVDGQGPRTPIKCTNLKSRDWCSSHYNWDSPDGGRMQYTYGCVWDENKDRCDSALNVYGSGAKAESYRCWPVLYTGDTTGSREDYDWGYGGGYMK